MRASSLIPGQLLLLLILAGAAGCGSRPVMDARAASFDRDPDAPLIIGFYGADLDSTFPNGDRFGEYADGNKAMDDLGRAAGAVMFEARDWRGARDWLLNQLDTNRDGVYDPQHGDHPRSIRIFGHSWGALSAIWLTQAIAGPDSPFRAKDIDLLAVIDPVNYARGPFGEVPSNVIFFWNRYQTGNEFVRIPIVEYCPHGQAVISRAARSEQMDLNPPPGLAVRVIKGQAVRVSHVSLLPLVHDELLQLLRHASR